MVCCFCSWKAIGQEKTRKMCPCRALCIRMPFWACQEFPGLTCSSINQGREMAGLTAEAECPPQWWSQPRWWNKRTFCLLTSNMSGQDEPQTECLLFIPYFLTGWWKLLELLYGLSEDKPVIYWWMNIIKQYIQR